MKNKIEQFIKKFKRSLKKDIKNELKHIKYKRKTNNKLIHLKKQLILEAEIQEKKSSVIEFFQKNLKLMKGFLSQRFKYFDHAVKKLINYIKNVLHNTKNILNCRTYSVYGLFCLIVLFLHLSIVNISSFSFENNKNNGNNEILSISGYYVFIDNIEIGLIENEKSFYNIVNQLDEEFSWFTIDDKIEKLITFTKNTNDFTIPSKVELQNRLVYFLNEHQKSWTISTENQKIITLATFEQAEQVLQQIKEFFTPIQKEDETIENISLGFIENTEIRLSITKNDNIHTPEEAFNYLLKGTTEDKVYTIVDGDTVWDIAIEYNIPVTDIEKANPNKNLSAIHIGELLNLTVPKPYLHIDVQYTHIYNQNIQYDTRIIKDDTLYRTDYKIEQSGIYGKRTITALESYQNDQKVNSEVLNKLVLFGPQTQIIRIGTLRTPDDVLMSSFILPPDTGLITSKYGMRSGKLHTGIDLAISTGTSLLAFRSGTIIFSGRKSGYGKLVIIQHANDIVSYYAHMSEIQVNVGDHVSNKQQIGLSGNTGYSTGSHIHFEIRVNGSSVDPLEYVKQPVYTASTTQEEPEETTAQEIVNLEAALENEELGIGPMEE